MNGPVFCYPGVVTEVPDPPPGGSAALLHESEWAERVESAPPWLRAQARTVAFGMGQTEHLRRAGLEPSAVTSHSLGIYAALHAAGSLPAEGALAAAWRAGELIGENAGRHPGGLLAVVGLPEERLEAIVAEVGADLGLAARNGGAQFVLGGSPGALARARALAEPDALSVAELEAGGPLHTRAMEPVVPPMREFVETLDVKAPSIPYLCHRDASWVETADAARDALARQLAEPVLWSEVLRRLGDEGARVFVDVGPGDVLSRSVRWVLREARPVALDERRRSGGRVDASPEDSDGFEAVRTALAETGGAP